MRNPHVLLLLLLINFMQHSEAQEVKDTTNSKWAIGAAIAPVYTNGSVPDYNSWGNNLHFTHPITTSFGVKAKYNISKYFDFVLGLSYDHLSYVSIIDDEQVYMSGRGNYWLINLPIQINLNFSYSKFSFSFSPGFCISIVETNNGIYKHIFYGGNHQIGNIFSGTYKTYDNGSTLLFGTIAASISYKLNKKFSFYIQPEYLKSFNYLYPGNTMAGQDELDNYLKYFKTNIGFYYSL